MEQQPSISGSEGGLPNKYAGEENGLGSEVRHAFDLKAGIER